LESKYFRKKVKAFTDLVKAFSVTPADYSTPAKTAPQPARDPAWQANKYVTGYKK
jgi:hypothetical protein